MALETMLDVAEDYTNAPQGSIPQQKFETLTHPKAEVALPQTSRDTLF